VVPAPLRPRALRPGARIHIVAPSGPVPPDRLEAGLAALRNFVPGEISLAPNLPLRAGYFAGDDRARLDALQAALADPEIDAVVCARGGYGLTRLLPLLDPARLAAAPKLLVGFSDITALLAWALARVGLASVHGPVVTQLATVAPEDGERLALLLTGEDPGSLSAETGSVLRGGCVEGPLFAGNLEVLRSLVGTRAMPDLAGCVLALEEIGERPYRIDRALTQLLTSGALRGVRGVALGQLVACEEPATGNPDSPTAEEVLLERLGVLGVPVVTGFPFGHAPDRHAPLPVGSVVRLDAEHGDLTMLEPLTATSGPGCSS
jgi:muramoyltetrapeptide carboxypeptidase